MVASRLTGLWWWIDRWRKSSAYTGMTLEEQGAYRNLLDEAALRGGAIPEDENVLARACGDARKWRKVRTAVLARFVRKADGLHNETLDTVLAESQRRKDKQRTYRDNQRGNDDGNEQGHEHGNGVGNEQAPPDPDPDPDPGISLPEKAPGESVRARLGFSGKKLKVPKFLDEEFVDRLNGQYFDLAAFYLALDQRLANTGEAWDLRWIREQFAAKSPAPERRRQVRDERPIAPEERRKAEGIRRAWGRCMHDEKCETSAGCIAQIVKDWRDEEARVMAGGQHWTPDREPA